MVGVVDYFGLTASSSQELRGVAADYLLDRGYDLSSLALRSGINCEDCEDRFERGFSHGPCSYGDGTGEGHGCGCSEGYGSGTGCGVGCDFGGPNYTKYGGGHGDGYGDGLGTG